MTRGTIEGISSGNGKKLKIVRIWKGDVLVSGGTTTNWSFISQEKCVKKCGELIHITWAVVKRVIPNLALNVVCSKCDRNIGDLVEQEETMSSNNNNRSSKS